MMQFILTNILAVTGLSGALIICFAVTYFFPALRKWAIIAAVVFASISTTYMKGRWDQRAQDKQIAQQEAKNEEVKGKKGQADALRKFEQNKLPDAWFRDAE